MYADLYNGVKTNMSRKYNLDVKSVAKHPGGPRAWAPLE